MDEFKEGKDYVISVSTSFVGKFVRYQEDPRGGKIAVFESGGSGRNGPYERAVKTSNIISSELTKTYEPEISQKGNVPITRAIE